MAYKAVYHCDWCGNQIEEGELIFRVDIGRFELYGKGATVWTRGKEIELCAGCAKPVLEVLGCDFAEDGPLRSVKTGHLDSATLNRTSRSFAGGSSFSSRSAARQLNDPDQITSRG